MYVQVFDPYKVEKLVRISPLIPLNPHHVTDHGAEIIVCYRLNGADHDAN